MKDRYYYWPLPHCGWVTLEVPGEGYKHLDTDREDASDAPVMAQCFPPLE